MANQQKSNAMTARILQLWREQKYDQVKDIQSEQWELMQQYSFFWSPDMALLKPLCRQGCIFGGKQFMYPNNPEFRKRVSKVEFDAFVNELQDKLYEADPYCALLGLTLGLPLTFFCMLNFQLFQMRPHINHQNASFDVVARYNKYLFKPRGIRASFEGTEVSLPLMHSDTNASNNSDNTIWRVWFDIADEASPQAADRLFNQEILPDQPPPCPSLFCFLPSVKFQFDESLISDPSLEEKYASANQQIQAMHR